MSEWSDKELETERTEHPLTNSLKKDVNQQDSLKPRLHIIVNRTELQIKKLDQAKDRFRQKDKAIFARIVDAYTKHDTARACVFANELAEVRNIERLIIGAILELEQIVFRLREVTDFENVGSTICPVIGILRSVREKLVSVFPEAENELGEIWNILSGIMIEAGLGSGMRWTLLNEDAGKISTEAAKVAAQRIIEKIPNMLPSMTATLSKQSDKSNRGSKEVKASKSPKEKTRGQVA